MPKTGDQQVLQWRGGQESGDPRVPGQEITNKAQGLVQLGMSADERVEESVLGTSASLMPVPLKTVSKTAPKSATAAQAHITKFDGKSGLPPDALKQPALLVNLMKEHRDRPDILVQCCIALKVPNSETRTYRYARMQGRVTLTHEWRQS